MALREILARFGFDVDSGKLASADKQVSGLVDRFSQLGKAIIGAAVVQKIAQFTGNMIEMGVQLDATSKKLGVSAQELQRWHVAGDLVEVSAEQIDTALKFLAKGAAGEGLGQKEAEGFKKLGVEVKDASGQVKRADVLLREVGIALGNTSNASERVAIAQNLMGKQGANLLPLFVEGKEKLEEYLKVLEEYGGGMSDQFLKVTGDADNELDKFNVGWLSVKSSLIVAFLPALTVIIGGIAKAIAWLSRIANSTKAWQATLSVLGGILARLAIAKFGAQLIALGKAAMGPFAAITALIFLLDDLMVLFAGGKSVIGAGIDAIFGAGSAKAMVDTIKELVTEIGKVWTALKEGDFSAVAAAFQRMADLAIAAIDSIFDHIKKRLSEDLPAGLAKALGVEYNKTPFVTPKYVTPTEKQIAATSPEQLAATEKAFADLVRTGGKTPEQLANAAKAGAPEVAEGGKVLAKALNDGFAQGMQASGVQGVVSDWTQLVLKVARDGIGAHSPATGFIALARDALAGWQIPWKALGPGGAVASALAPTSASLPVARGGGGGPVFQTSVSLTVGAGTTPAQVGMARGALDRSLDDNRRAMLLALRQTAEVPT